MNITILSIYLSSMYSFSPLLTGQNTIIRLSNFKYFTQVILFNPLKLELNNNKFSFGLNSILISENINKNLLDETQELKDLYYNQTNYKEINFDKDKLNIIRDCVFNEIYSNSYPLIRISGNPTAYITSCLFSSCKSSNGILELNSKSITISHICCSNLTSISNNENVILFLKVSSDTESFVQLIYSTIFGTADQKSKFKNIISLGNKLATRYQCINVSNFKQATSSELRSSICALNAPKCVNMLMSSFINFSAHNALYLGLQDGDVKYSHYVDQCNFINKNFAIKIYLDLNQNTRIYFDKCIFSSEYEISFVDNPPGSGSNICIKNCFFNKDTTFSNYYKTYSNTVISNLTPIPLAHFITTNKCIGEKVENAYGCNNNTCPDNQGCGEDDFSFKSGDVTYSLKFHPDIDTPKPTPTVEFSQSFKFSQSFAFSKSSKFTNSLNFAESSKFTESLEFTGSCKYTKSKMFTKSSLFTQTAKFSESFIFTESLQGKITSSSLFSKSNIFTLSDVLPNIPVNNGDDSNNKSKVGMIAGIASGAAAAAIAGGIAIFFLVRKPQIPEIGNLETIDDEANVITNKNPLYNNNAEDDPFKDDFVNN